MKIKRSFQQPVQPKENKKKGFVLLVLFLLIALIMGFKFYKYETTRPLTFSPENWDTQPSNRIRMIDSLLEQYHGLQGMTQEDLTELLGKNTYTAYDDTYVVGDGNFLQDGIILQFFFHTEGFCSGFVISQDHKIIFEYKTPSV